MVIIGFTPKVCRSRTCKKRYDGHGTKAHAGVLDRKATAATQSGGCRPGCKSLHELHATCLIARWSYQASNDSGRRALNFPSYILTLHASRTAIRSASVGNACWTPFSPSASQSGRKRCQERMALPLDTQRVTSTSALCQRCRKFSRFVIHGVERGSMLRHRQLAVTAVFASPLTVSGSAIRVRNRIVKRFLTRMALSASVGFAGRRV